MARDMAAKYFGYGLDTIEKMCDTLQEVRIHVACHYCGGVASRPAL